MRKLLFVAAAILLVTGAAQAGTIVNNGELIVNGDIDLGWDLTGNGKFTTDGTISFSGTSRPGMSPGTFTYNGDMLYEASHNLIIELAGNGGVGGVDHDLINVVSPSTLTLGGNLTVMFYDTFNASSVSAGDAFTFMTAGPGASILGSFATLDFSNVQLSNGLYWQLIYGQNSVTLAALEEQQEGPASQAPPVPEPATLGLFGLGLAALIARSKRRVRL